MIIPSSSENEAFEIVEEVLKNRAIYEKIIQDVKAEKIKKPEKFDRIEYILECTKQAKEYMTPKEIKFINYKYFHNMTYKNISEKMDISRRSVANWRTRALEKIARRAALI